MRLLAPLARDLREWRIASGHRTGLVFPAPAGKDSWSESDWDNWRERVFCPAASPSGSAGHPPA